MSKSRRTGIRLRANTLGHSQSTYTSPNNLPPEKEKITYSYLDQTSSPIGKRPTPKELPDQPFLQTRQRNTQAKCVPSTPNATQRLQMDLLLSTANLTALGMTWHSAPSQVKSNSELIHLNSPPTKPQKYKTKILAQHSQRLIPAQLNNRNRGYNTQVITYGLSGLRTPSYKGY